MQDGYRLLGGRAEEEVPVSCLLLLGTATFSCRNQDWSKPEWSGINCWAGGGDDGTISTGSSNSIMRLINRLDDGMAACLMWPNLTTAGSSSFGRLSLRWYWTSAGQMSRDLTAPGSRRPLGPLALCFVMQSKCSPELNSVRLSFLSWTTKQNFF